MNGEYTDVRRGRDAGERSPLDVVSGAFERIADEPVPAGPRPMPSGVAGSSWGAVRGQLRASALPFETVDALWGWLIEHARGRWAARGGQAVLACCGLAVPMLAEITGRYAVAGSAHRVDAEAEMVAGFVRLVCEIDLDSPHLWPRLRFATWHVGRSWAHQQAAAPMAADLDDDAAAHYLDRMRIPEGHPELVLAEAVAAEVITAEAAELIAATRLGQRTLHSVTQQLWGSQSYWMVRRQHQRAEHALAAWLTERARDPGPVSVVEARVVNEHSPVAGVDPAQLAREAHRRRTSTTRPASGSPIDQQTRPDQQTLAAARAKEARQCA